MEETYNLILGVAGVIITLLLAGNLYFVKSFIKSSDSVATAVNELRIIVVTEKAKSGSFQTNCEKVHNHLDLVVDYHAKKLEDHEKRIAIQESKSDNL